MIMDRSEYGSTANTMITCTTARPTSAIMKLKCHHRAHTKPPNSDVSQPRLTGFQMASPESTMSAASGGMAK